jgi:hypothetical protein
MDDQIEDTRDPSQFHREPLSFDPECPDCGRDVDGTTEEGLLFVELPNFEGCVACAISHVPEILESGRATPKDLQKCWEVVSVYGTYVSMLAKRARGGK